MEQDVPYHQLLQLNLSKGMNIVDSVRGGKEYITGAIKKWL